MTDTTSGGTAMIPATGLPRQNIAFSIAAIAVTAWAGEFAPSAAQVDRSETSVALPAAAPIPKGATTGPDGYATILFAPSTSAISSISKIPVASPPPPTNGRPTPMPMTREARAARARMMNPDQATREAAQVLNGRLSTAERGNYIGLRIVRDPGPRVAFQFRRNAAATLAKYTRDPRFTWREGGIPVPELQPIFDEWWKRFEPHRLVGGGSVYEFDGFVRFDMNVDEATYREIAAIERWTLPKRLELRFSPLRNSRSIDPALVRYVRLFAREDRRPAIVHTAALKGRIIIRDGCFYLTEHGASGEASVVFGRDLELGVDAQGYMILVDRASSRPAPRVGETMVWGGPRYYSDSDPIVKELRAKCGAAPIIAVGEPQSSSAFR